MAITVVAEAQSPLKRGHDLVALLLTTDESPRRAGALKDANSATGGAIARALKHGDFTGKARETLVLYPEGKARTARLILCGVGSADGTNANAIRRATGAVVDAAGKMGAHKIAISASKDVTEAVGTADTAAAITEATVLANYRFVEFKTKREDKSRSPRISRLALHIGGEDDLIAVREAAKTAKLIAECANIARDVGNQPGNAATPAYMAQKAEELGKSFGLTCKVLDQKAIEKQGMGGLLGVGKGSDNQPTFTILEHKPAGAKETVCIVGKGVTFDSGGISIKPADKMWDMKFDKCGACAVLGIMAAVARLDLPLHVVGLIPAAENMPGARANKPGDILRTMDGQTIEVQNTDAEGRLILADALAYATRYKPAAVVDLATLTGAIVVALGSLTAGVFGTDEELISDLLEAGGRSGERLWHMPLFDEYSELLKSDYADMKNIGGRWGGAITAASFLRRFAENYPWAHVDIAGTAWNADGGDKAYLGKGATGFGVRIIVDMLRARAGRNAVEAS